MDSSYGAETLTLAEEGLDESTIRSSISSADMECFPYCHESHNCVKQERSNLGKNRIKDRGVNGICMLTKNPIKQDNISSSQTRGKSEPTE